MPRQPLNGVFQRIRALAAVRADRERGDRELLRRFVESADEAAFKWLYAYSPYHHVKSAPYPAVLFMSADSDDRVDPMHARKMAAALQTASTSGRPILLRIEKHAGHGGADLVRQAIEYSADNYAFMMKEVGLTPAQRPGT